MKPETRSIEDEYIFLVQQADKEYINRNAIDFDRFFYWHTLLRVLFLICRILMEKK